MSNNQMPPHLDDTSWLAVEGGTVERIARMLGLSDLTPATWAQGMDVVGGFLDDFVEEVPHGTSSEFVGVYLTPLIRGWRLVVGYYVGAAPMARDDDDLRNGWRRVAGWCRRLSREFGAAHAFTDQAQLDWYSWIIARDGFILRQVVYDDGEFLSDRGRPTGIEARRVARFRPDEIRLRWCPDVGDVPKIAGEWSVNPWKIGPRSRTVGPGFVALTPYGRQMGLKYRGPSRIDTV
jgi:hypothetical protein